MRTGHLSPILAAAAILLLSPAPAASTPEGEGVLVLATGERVPGRLLARGGQFKLLVGGRLRTWPAGRVSHWVPREQVLAEFHRLAAVPGADRPFARTQLALRALENGLQKEAWPLVAGLLEERERPAAFTRLERLVLAQTAPRLDPRDPPLAQARSLVLALGSRSGTARARARLGIFSRRLADLLAREKEPGALHAYCRSVAEGGFGSPRRRLARSALLGAAEPARRFVYRLALRNPAGPRRARVLADIRRLGFTDEAAVYLGRGLAGLDPRLLPRAVDTLGGLASPRAVTYLTGLRGRLARARAGGDAVPGPPRNHVAILRTTSYLKDYDVEIASSAFIADPIVDQVSSGVVLDARVLHVEIHRFFLALDRSLDRALE